MSLAYHGKSTKRRGYLAGLGLFAVFAAIIGGLIGVRTTLAHHLNYNASATCTTWSAIANYVGGPGERLILFDNVVINGQLFEDTWANAALNVQAFSATPLGIPFDAAGTPASIGMSPEFMGFGVDAGNDGQNDTDDGNPTNMFTRNETITGLPLDLTAGSWSGRIVIFWRGSQTPAAGDGWRPRGVVTPDDGFSRDISITAPTADTSCGITVKKVVTSIDNDGTAFSGTIAGANPFTDLTETDPDGITQNVANGQYTVTETNVPVGYTLLGYALGDAQGVCPNGPTPGFAGNVTVANNIQTVCIYNSRDLVCTPSTQPAAIGETATVQATGGTGTYSWTGDGTPPTGSGSAFSTAYATSGTKTVIVESGGLTASCEVVVAPPGTGSIKVIKVVPKVADDPTVFGGTVTSSTPVSSANWSDSETTDGPAVTGLTLGVVYTVTETTPLPAGYYEGKIAYVVDADGVCEVGTGEDGYPATYTTNPPEVTLMSDAPNQFVCVYNERLTGTIVVAKVQDPAVTEVDTTTTFGGAINGEVDGTWGPIAIGDADFVTTQFPTGTYTITENAPANGWTLVGFALGSLAGGENPVCSTDPADYSSAANFTFEIGEDELVCVMNTKDPEIRLINVCKRLLDNNDGATLSNVGFSGGAGNTTWSASVTEGGQMDCDTGISVPAGPAIVTETVWAPNATGFPKYAVGTSTEISCDAASANVLQGRVTLTAPNNTVVFCNQATPNEPGRGQLVIRKVLDFNGDGDQDAGEPFIAWTATVTGPAGSGYSGTGVSITVPNLTIPNLLAGTYTVVEATAPNYKAIGATSQGAAVSASGPATVTFYNQPRVNIVAVKTLVDNGDTSIGSGWTFTLRGCGIASQIKTTGATGSVSFTDLPPAVGCVYTVTETTQAGWTPDFVSAQVSPTAAGSTATVTFINRRFNITIVTPTPPVATPTTPPATVTQPAVISTPTAVTTTEVQTPASNTTAISVETPKPPVTGTGVEASRVSDSWLLMVAGAMFAAVTGFSLIAMGRKRVTNDR